MILFLPACSFPLGNVRSVDNLREKSLISNLFYLKSKGFPFDQIVVVDNGYQKPSVPNGVHLIHDHSLFSDIPQVGEALMTMKAAKEIGDNILVLKLHSRCKLLNMTQLLKYVTKNEQFIFVRRNLFRFNRHHFNKCPFAETRLYSITSNNLISLMDIVVSFVNQSIEFEHAFLSAAYQVRDVRSSLRTHGYFYPIFEGSSGHGVNYSSITVRVNSYIRKYLYTVGI